MTTGARLVQLSGLSGVSAATHLIAIKQSGSNAGDMLVSRSGLTTGTAMEHLISNTDTTDLSLWWKYRTKRRC